MPTWATTMVMCSSLQVAKMNSPTLSVGKALAILQPDSSTPMEEPMKQADLSSIATGAEASPRTTAVFAVGTSSPSSA